MKRPIPVSNLPIAEIRRVQAPYIKYLRKRAGETVAENYVSKMWEEYLSVTGHRAEVAQSLRGPPRLRRSSQKGHPLHPGQPTAYLSIPMVQLGNSTIFFSTHSYAFEGVLRDPINIIFHDQARPVNVGDLIRHYLKQEWKSTRVWHLLCAEKQFIYLYSSGQGRPKQVWMHDSLSPQGCSLGHRIHIRTFDCGLEQSMGYVTVGAVHEEAPRNMTHVVTGWDSAQSALDQQFDKSLRFVGGKHRLQLQKKEVLQGVSHDGEASVIRVL